MTDKTNEEAFFFEMLDSSHKKLRKNFDCGVAPLNTYLKQYASQHQKSGAGKTFLFLGASRQEILGFYTLSASLIHLDLVGEEARSKLSKHPISAVRISRLARNLSSKGKGFGEILLLDALHRSIKQEIGVQAVEVDAKDQRAKDFYKKFGFIELLDDSQHLYISLEIIRRVLGK